MDKTYQGIDVSRWQGVIDWARVKASGVEFAFIRVGYCGYEGEISQDIRFADNMKGALAAGVPVGVYLYSYAKTGDAARKAAGAVLELVKGYSLEYPVAFDIEDTLYASMSRAANTEITRAFLSAVAQAGYCPLLYTYKSFAESSLTMDDLGEYDFWLSHIAAQTSYKGPYTVWQYSWTGKVDGISGDVDQNTCYKDYPAFIRESGLNGLESSGGDVAPGAGGSGEEGGQSEAPQEAEGISYVVVKNDTLSHIAQRHGIPLRVLLQANPQVKNPNLIYVGQIIHIPKKP